MTTNLYFIYDTKLERSNLPFFARNDQEAVVLLIRSNIPKTIYNDSKLFRLGSFDDEKAHVDGLSLDLSEVKLPPYPEEVNHA